MRTLTFAQCVQAALGGAMRRIFALQAGRPDRYGYKERDPWGTDIESAGAELATALELGLYWTPWAKQPQDVPADVGRNVGVRWRSLDHGCLITHHTDEDDHYYVLVTGRMPNYTPRGFMRGAETKTPERWGDPFHTGRPAFWTEQSDLLPFDELRRWAA